MRALPSLCALLVLGAFSVATVPIVVADEPAGGSVATITRLVKLFLDREGALSAAMRAGDMASLERMLTDDFELRTGARAASPIPRADFLSDVARNRPASGIANRMAVHDLDGTAIVSFVQGDETRSAIFVVDVWRRSGTDWKLAIRYAGPAGARGFPIPGATTPPSQIPKKY